MNISRLNWNFFVKVCICIIIVNFAAVNPAFSEKNIEELKKSLLHAVENNDIEKVKSIVQNGIDINTPIVRDASAVYVAISYGHIDLARYFFEKKANLDPKSWNARAALIGAVNERRYDSVNLLLKLGVDVNSTMKDSSKTEQWMASRTPLMWASNHGDIQMVSLLLDRGADVSVSDSIGYTALMLAAANGNLKLIKLLVQAGADISAKEKNMGQTAIDIAKSEGFEEVQKYLEKMYKQNN